MSSTPMTYAQALNDAKQMLVQQQLRIKADAELYFEEGELLTPPTMKQTAEEKKSGF